MSAFNAGAAPRISVYNRARTALRLDLADLVQALQAYVDRCLAPVWGCPAQLMLAPGPQAGEWGLAFLDDADAPGALAYHTEEDGLPLSKVFVRTVLDAGESLSVSASHELAEMLVDPAINLLASGAGKIVAYEVADPCEADADAFAVAGHQMSDFVYPAWFEGFRGPNSTKFDHCGRIDRPFQLLPGGYMSTWDGKEWSQVFGSTAKAGRFALEDRRGHRSELRVPLGKGDER